MKEDRFKVIQESKFERLSNKDLQSVKGGLCISCKRRARTVEVGTGKDTYRDHLGREKEMPAVLIRIN